MEFGALPIKPLKVILLLPFSSVDSHVFCFETGRVTCGDTLALGSSGETLGRDLKGDSQQNLDLCLS